MKFINSHRRQAGLTIVEISFVLAIIGLVYAFVAPRYTAKQDAAKAGNMLRLADTSRDSLSKYDLECGTGTLVTGNSLPADGKTIEDVIFGGDGNVNDKFQSPTSNCAKDAGAKSMTDLARKNGSGNGYVMNGSAVSLVDVAGDYTGTAFVDVSKSQLESLLSKVRTNASVAAAGDSTDNRVRYTVNGSKYNVTILAK